MILLDHVAPAGQLLGPTQQPMISEGLMMRHNNLACGSCCHRNSPQHIGAWMGILLQCWATLVEQNSRTVPGHMCKAETSLLVPELHISTLPFLLLRCSRTRGTAEGMAHSTRMGSEFNKSRRQKQELEIR